jgi:hypothetical protein
MNAPFLILRVSGIRVGVIASRGGSASAFDAPLLFVGLCAPRSLEPARWGSRLTWVNGRDVVSVVGVVIRGVGVGQKRGVHGAEVERRTWGGRRHKDGAGAKRFGRRGDHGPDRTDPGLLRNIHPRIFPRLSTLR